eukprot:1826640-Pyramimonas_sp.AAC.1
MSEISASSKLTDRIRRTPCGMPPNALIDRRPPFLRSTLIGCPSASPRADLVHGCRWPRARRARHCASLS